MKTVCSSYSLAGWSCILGLFILVGCGTEKPNDLFSVSGKITYDGKPLPKGSITFAPDASQNNKGPGATAEIKDGTYETQPGKGISGGPYLMTINGYDGVPVPSGEGGMDQMGTPLFEAYQSSIDLPKEDTQYDIAIPQQK